MAIIIPDNPEPRTNGEDHLIKLFQCKLPDTWLVFYEPLIKNQKPDFVLFEPHFGVLVLEVKDYIPSTIHSLTTDIWVLDIDGEKVNVKSPLIQARENAFSVMNLLLTNDQLKQEDGDYRGNLQFPVTYGCVFTNLTNAEIEFIGINKVIGMDFIISKDDLQNIEKKLVSLFDKTFGINALSRNISDLVSQMIYPEIIVRNVEDNSCNLDEFFEKYKIKIFDDVIDEILYIATEIKHLLNKKVAKIDEVTILAPKNRRLKNENLYEIVKLVMKDMGVPSAINIEEFNTFSNVKTQSVIFLMDCNRIRGFKEKEAMFYKIINIAPENIYLTSSK